MIYTLTLNPAVDHFLTLEGELLVDEVNRGESEVFRAGGKGLNLSRDLALLGVSSAAVALLGGFTGRFIADSFSAQPLIDLRAVEVPGNNRINLKAHYDGKALCINGPGPMAPPDAPERLLAALEDVGAGDWVLVCGSRMAGLGMESVYAVADLAHARGARLVLDMESATLEELSRCRPHLIKPNLYELGLLLGREIPAGQAAQALREGSLAGLPGILLSLGREGALLRWEGALYRMDQPRDLLVNKVGCGDAMLAAFVARLTQGAGPEEALTWAGAAGNARAATLEELTAQGIRAFLPRIAVERIA